MRFCPLIPFQKIGMSLNFGYVELFSLLCVYLFIYIWCILRLISKQNFVSVVVLFMWKGDLHIVLFFFLS